MRTLIGGIVASVLMTAPWSTGQAEGPRWALTELPVQPSGLAWPTEGWPEANLPTDVKERVDAVIDKAFLEDNGMGETRAVVLIKNGRLVAERYREGYTPDMPMVSWSMAKSITHALVGVAVENGHISDLDAPMPTPWPDHDPRSQINWRHWMSMTDGLAYRELTATSLMNNDVVQMMYGPGRLDVVEYIKDLRVLHAPGEQWNYTTAGAHLIGRALQDVTGTGVGKADAFTAWMQSELFKPIGVSATPEYDSAGTFLAGSLVYMSARDFAKFGYLYLRDGVWENQRLLPEGWVDSARSPGPDAESDNYGALWWLTPPDGRGVPSPGASDYGPRDLFSAQGHEGQITAIVPSQDIVVVRLGDGADSGDEWLALYDWVADLVVAAGQG